MSSEIENAKKLRTHSKIKLTKAARALEEQVALSQSKERLEYSISEFCANLATYDEHQKTVELSLPDEEQIIAEVDSGTTYREPKIEILIKAKEALHKLTELQIQDKKADGTMTEELNMSRASSSESERPAVKAALPKLELPYFGGDILEWQSFWDQFSAAPICQMSANVLIC